MLRRLRKEYQIVQQQFAKAKAEGIDRIHGCITILRPITMEGKKVITQWEGQIAGAAGTAYEGYLFDLSINFTSEYPVTPPTIRFTTSVLHPNIATDGVICVSFLKEEWVPKRIDINIMKLVSLLDLDQAVPSDALNVSAGSLMQANPVDFEKAVRAYCEQYAQPDLLKTKLHSKPSTKPSTKPTSSKPSVHA